MLLAKTREEKGATYFHQTDSLADDVFSDPSSIHLPTYHLRPSPHMPEVLSPFPFHVTNGILWLFCVLCVLCGKSMIGLNFVVHFFSAGFPALHNDITNACILTYNQIAGADYLTAFSAPRINLPPGSRELSGRSGDLSAGSRDLSPGPGEFSERGGDLSPRSADLSGRGGDLSPRSADLSESGGDLSAGLGELSGGAGKASNKPTVISSVLLLRQVCLPERKSWSNQRTRPRRNTGPKASF